MLATKLFTTCVPYYCSPYLMWQILFIPWQFDYWSCFANFERWWMELGKSGKTPANATWKLFIVSIFCHLLLVLFGFFLWHCYLKILCLIHYIWDLQKDSTCFIWLAPPRVLINYILMCPCGSIWKMVIASFFFREFSQKQNIQQSAIPSDFPEWFSYIQLIITKEFICVIYSIEKVWPVTYMGSLKYHTVHDSYDTFLHLILLWTACTQKTTHQFRGMSMQVTACSKCNSKKGQKTLEEANMKLIKTPKVFSVFINNCPTPFSYNGKRWFSLLHLQSL